ncbi:phenylacetate--CoA ligase family protein [Streptomyces sp. AK08-02]|uniref:phenylacetate--CoA ligase family protein n=1 Tax=Streptomyces sp. AK08-02 TaxID=3028654 RepID=UPI0029ABC3E6|nr:phenylacetate--CoA ligase family protein [Streptomyces sp. AK08-02]MDX3745565.1 phenylacetate--CoA ligase family protein [Streptomyces sp. AK08-02]
MVGDRDTAERYFEPQVETMPREQLRAEQEKRVLELVEYAYTNSAFYRELWDAHGVRPRDIRSLGDFRQRVPFITKDMVRAYRARTGDPFGGLLCVPVEELTSVSSSSGTTGDPEFFAEIWQDAPPLVTAQVRDLWELGLRPGDRVLSPPGTFRNLMDPGYQALGAVVIEVDTWMGKMHEVVEALRTYRPAYLQMMYPQMVELEHLAEKTDLKEAFSSLKGASCAGQPLSRKMRERIRDDWGIDVYEYTSAADTGTAWECREHDGFHLWEDTVFAECVEFGADGWREVPEGDLGELVATDLDNRAAPLIRYRSEDLVRLSGETCGCGRTHARMWVAGRSGDETLVQGRSVVLRDIWQAVEEQPETVAGVFQIVRNGREVDELRLRVGYDPALTGDVDALAGRLGEAVRTRTGVEPVLDLRTEEDLLKTMTSVAKFPRVVKS